MEGEARAGSTEGLGSQAEVSAPHRTHAQGDAGLEDDSAGDRYGESVVLAEIGRTISSSVDIEEVYEVFAEQVRKLIPFERIAISLVDSQHNTFTNAYVVDPAAGGRQPGDVVPLSGTLVELAVREPVSQIVHGDESELAVRFPSLVLADLHSILLVPMVHKGEVIGVLNLRSAERNVYNDRHRLLAESVSAQIAGAVANARIYARQRETEAALRESEEIADRLAKESAVVAEISRVLSSAVDIHEVYDLFAEEVRKLVPFDRIVIELTSEDSDTFTTAYVAGVDVLHRRPNEVIPLAGSTVEELLRTRKSLLVQTEDLSDIKDRFPGLVPGFEAGLRSFLSVPLIAKGEAIGALLLRSATPNAYTEHHLSLVEYVAYQIAGTIANSELYLELKRAEQELARSNTDLGHFAYAASHDLQEPLRIIASYLKLLADRYQGRLDSDADDFIGYAVDGADRMKLLVEDLLEFSRVGTQVRDFQPISCREALEQAVSNLQEAIDETKASVTHHDLPRVNGDGGQLAVLFQNLVGNAIKYRGAQAPRVHVSSEMSGNEWVVSVADNGIGIAPEHHEQVFGMLERLHGRDKYPGTGIGLATCSRIVERHGGRLWVESQLRKGSIFRFTLPVAGT